MAEDDQEKCMHGLYTGFFFLSESFLFFLFYVILKYAQAMFIKVHG